MRFLVIGASGFVGRHVLAAARARGYEALGTATSPCPSSGLIAFDLAKDRLADKVPAGFFKTGDPVFMVVCAMISQIDRCRREYRKTRIINVKNTLRLMDDASASGARPVYLTSGFVFDGRNGYYTETDPHSPISEYGRQKAEIEIYCRERHPDWFLARLDKVVGYVPDERHLLSEWYEWAQTNRPIICMQNQVFAPTCVDDVADAVILGCSMGLEGLFNIANSEYFAREELARQFLRLTGCNAPIVCRSQKELGFEDLRPERSYLDSSKFTRATGMHFMSMRQVISRFREKVSLKY